MIDAELDTLKRQPFEAVAMNLGYHRLKGETGTSLTLKNGAGDKVIAKLDGQHWVYFGLHDRSDNGSVLDFVQRRVGGTLGHARKWLREIAGSPKLLSPTAQTPDRDSASTVDPDHCYKKTQAVWNAATWNPAPDYLLSRGLAPATLSDPRFRDCWRVDRSGNAIFPHFDTGGMCGYERRGPDCKSFGKDTRRGLWRSANLWSASTTEIVICEAPIDALSHYQLTGGSLGYVATGGALGQRQIDLLGLLFKRVIRSDRVWVTVGTDNDPAGDAMYEQIALIAPMKVYRSAAISKDWNADLMWTVRETGGAI
jgi:hypothetical protein